MSHELRTPLNSLLILAQAALGEQGRATSRAKQVEFAQTIYSSGTDLLNLINDVLDLSKVEAGKMEVNADRRADARRASRSSSAAFRPVARAEGARRSRSTCSPSVPATIYTDGQRLQQVLKNLLSNAFKFTEQGGVTLTIRTAEKGRRFANRIARPGGDGDRVRRDRHGHRHREGQAAAHLRGVPAGRRHDEPQVRRHGARPLDQPRDRAPARRRDPRGEHAGPREHVHAVPARAVRRSGARRATRGRVVAPARRRRRGGVAGASRGRPSGVAARVHPGVSRGSAVGTRRRRRRLGASRAEATAAAPSYADRRARRADVARLAAASGGLRRRPRLDRARATARC